MNTLITFIVLTLSTQLYSAEYQVDSVRVYKTQHRMEMMFQGEVTKVYTVMLGRGGMAPKRQEGDKRVPEGEYELDYKNPYSKFYRSIHITYPNLEDIERAKKMGVNPGFDIFIHGMPNYYSALSMIMDDDSMDLLFENRGDWTAGCIAVENYEMKEIWENMDIEFAPIPITIYH